MNSIFNVREGNVIYSVDCSKFDPIVITVINDKTKVEITKEYNLQYPQAIFGYDCMDVSNVNKLLDETISLLK